MFQNAGEKGIPHLDPDDPPRRRANKRRGHGTFENDRPPVAGTVGRASGEIELAVVHHTNQATLQDRIESTTVPGAVVNTDEWSGYSKIESVGRVHRTVCHSPDHREWARDDDGDGIREVHSNTIEGIWTGLRNFLRPFRGVSKWFLSQYVATFQCIHNYVDLTPDLFATVWGRFSRNTA